MFLNSSGVKDELSREILKSIAYQNFGDQLGGVLSGEIHSIYIRKEKGPKSVSFYFRREKTANLTQRNQKKRKK